MVSDPKELMVDRRIGKNIDAARRLAGLSMSGLAKKVGVSHQQVQKYIVAENRVSASRLVTIAEALDVSVTELYAGAV